MVIDNKYNIGDKVYLITDEDQLMRIVSRITIAGGGNLLYELSQGTRTSNHYEFEISYEKDILVKQQ